MAWFLLYLAGAFEVVWATSMKASNGFSHVGWSVMTGVAAFVSFWLLAQAMRELPLATAYTVWMGIGAAGAFVVGVLVFGETLTVWRGASLVLILVGLMGLRLSSGGA